MFRFEKAKSEDSGEEESTTMVEVIEVLKALVVERFEVDRLFLHIGVSKCGLGIRLGCVLAAHLWRFSGQITLKKAPGEDPEIDGGN